MPHRTTSSVWGVAELANPETLKGKSHVLEVVNVIMRVSYHGSLPGAAALYARWRLMMSVSVKEVSALVLSLGAAEMDLMAI